MADKFSDVLTYVLSLALAAAVIAFAAYKVVALNGMENPPANLGLNFPPAQRKVIMEGPQGADPITTQSLAPAARATAPAGDGGRGPFGYELITVVDKVAFVAVTSQAERTLVPVTAGSTLPGGLVVSEIGRRDGRWWLAAGALRLEQGSNAPQ